MKTFDYDFNGRTFHLAMNANALFDTYEKYGDKRSIAELPKGTGKKSFDATCWMLAKFAEQGELVRRYDGFKAETIVTESYFRLHMKPLDVPVAKKVLEQAIVLGFAREEESAEARDPYLAEYQKKTETD
jgi:hypothetical protein